MNKLPNTIPTLPGAAGELETFAMANCLMILSNQRNAAVVCGGGGGGEEEETGRSYPCKTCGRKFLSFQALGGHRASHKKIKSAGVNEVSNIPAKLKVHACSICGVEFPIGQALGGHMRRHRGLLVGSGGGCGGAMVVSSVSTEGSVGNDSDDGNNNGDDEKKRKMIDDHDDHDDVGGGGVPVLRKSSSSKRVCLNLDLTLRLWRKQDEEEVVVEQGSHVNDDHFLKLELRCH